MLSWKYGPCLTRQPSDAPVLCPMVPELSCSRHVLYFYGMSDKNETPPLYARFHGVLWMYCPNCGTQLRQQTNARGPWTTQCTRADCKRVWAFGIAVRPVMAGAHEVPSDHIFPPARWVQERWRRGQNLNVLDLKSSS